MGSSETISPLVSLGTDQSNPASADTADPDVLLRRVCAGEVRCWADLLACYHPRLMRMVELRLDSRLRPRLDPADVLQETYLAAAEHLTSYVSDRQMPFYLWLRGIACNKLLELHRRHLKVQMRAVSREVSLHRAGFPEATSAILASQLISPGTRPSEVAVRAERRQRLERILDSLSALDREILALRHFEQMSITETALVLGLTEKAAGKRYLRALQRLRQFLTDFSEAADLWT